MVGCHMHRTLFLHLDWEHPLKVDIQNTLMLQWCWKAVLKIFTSEIVLLCSCYLKVDGEIQPTGMKNHAFDGNVLRSAVRAPYSHIYHYKWQHTGISSRECHYIIYAHSVLLYGTTLTTYEEGRYWHSLTNRCTYIPIYVSLIS